MLPRMPNVHILECPKVSADDGESVLYSREKHSSKFTAHLGVMEWGTLKHLYITMTTSEPVHRNVCS